MTSRSSRKRIVLWVVTLTPLLSLLALVTYLLFFTTVPLEWYMQSVRNSPWDCLEFSSATYVYKARPGECRLNRLEYDVVLTSDRDGFRNGIRGSRDYDVAVIGDSFAQGFGVADDHTFAHLLEVVHHYRTINLGIGSYATLRELEVLGEYGKDATYVIVQYCDNDFGENRASIKLGKEEFRADVEKIARLRIATYYEGKAMGYRKPLRDLAVMLRYRTYTSRAAWRRRAEQRRMEEEASTFAQIVARYRPVLEGKRLIVVETALWGTNSPRFKATFETELNRLGWLRSLVLDSADILTPAHHFLLDEHINRRGHEALAVALAAEITTWERADPVIVRPR